MGVAGLVFILLLVEWVYGSLYLGVKRVRGLGNFSENVALIPPPKEGRFRFAAIGDPKEGQTIYQHLMSMAYDQGASFVVCNGDLVDRATPESFELFNHGYQSLGQKALPTFSALGNHDDSPLRLFQEYYGPESFAFLYGGSLFIFADNNSPESLEGCASYVRDQIHLHGNEAKHVFIVLHKPITDHEKDERIVRNRHRSGYMYDILDSEKVDAVLTGHFHGYAREEYNGKLLLVTGGAGARLHDARAFYHMVLIDVGPDGIKDTVVRLDEVYPFTDRLRVEAVVNYPLFFGSWWRPLLLLLVGGGFVFAGLKPARKPTGRERAVRATVGEGA